MSEQGRRVVLDDDDVRDRQSTWHGTVAVVLVLLLLLFSITWVFTRPTFQPEDEEDEAYPWEGPVEPRVISEDTTWQGQTVRLDQPVVIEEGATLRIEDMEVQVDLLDLVFWQRPAFRVRAGGALVVEDAWIRIIEGQRVESTVVGDVWLREDAVPNLARLVNLGNTTQPMLVFNYSCRYNDVPIAVGVLPEHGDELEVVGVFEQEDTHLGEWRTVSASLEEYAGTRPHVVIFPSEYPKGLMAISGLRVEEYWGEETIGDWFPTGNAQGDGWEMWGFTDLGWMMEAYVNGSHSSSGLGKLWKGLIEADGDVTLSGSNITAPPDLPRRGARNRVKDSLDGDPAHEILGTATRGGHISLDGARLTIVDSTIKFVPVLCNGTYLDVSGTYVRGDGDLFTLNASRGTLEKVTFVGVEPTPGRPFEHAEQRLLWALGINGTLEGYWTEVLNCSFHDCQQSLDLSHATVRLARCGFYSTQRLSIWDHASALYDLDGSVQEGWDDLLDSNFISSRGEGDWYLRTNRTRVFLEDPASGPIEPLSLDGPVYGVPLYSPPQWNLLSTNGSQSWVVTPVLLVDAHLREFHEDQVYLKVETDHGYIYPTFGGDKALVVVDVTEEHPLPAGPVEDLRFHGFSKAPDGEPGAFDANMGIVPGRFEATDLRITLEWDGGSDTIAVEQAGIDPGDWYWLILTVELAPGINQINASVTGVPVDGPGGERSVLHTERFEGLRLSGDMRDLPPETVFLVDGVAIEPGEDAILGNLSLPEGEDEGSVRIAGLEDSTVGIGGLEIPRWGHAGISVAGGINLEIRDVEGESLTIHQWWAHEAAQGRSPRITLDNATLRTLSISCEASIALRHVTTYDVMHIYSYYHKNVDLFDCSIYGYGARIEAEACNVTLVDCNVFSDIGRGVSISGVDTAYVGVADCRFEGAFLALFRGAWEADLEASVEFSENTFWGEGAFLYVGFNVLDMSDYDLDPDYVLPLSGRITNNDFIGAGAGIVLHHGLYAELFMSNNELTLGATQHAYYVLTFRVMDTVGTPPRPEFVIIPSGQAKPADLFTDLKYIQLEGEMLLDVTGNTSLESDPPDVAVLLMAGYYPNSKVRGFAAIDPLVDAGEIKLVTRVPFEEMLLDHVVYWPGRKG